MVFAQENAVATQMSRTLILGLSATQTPTVNSGRLQGLSCECSKHISSVYFCPSLLTAFQALTWQCICGSMWSRPTGATAIQNFSSAASLGHGCPIAPCLRARGSQGWDGSPSLQFPPYSGPVCGQGFMILWKTALHFFPAVPVSAAVVHTSGCILQCHTCSSWLELFISTPGPLRLGSHGGGAWRLGFISSPGDCLWCCERLKAGGAGDNRGQDGWMASLTQWTRVWASSRRWWKRQSMGSQRVGHDWVAEQEEVMLICCQGREPPLCRKQGRTWPLGGLGQGQLSEPFSPHCQPQVPGGFCPFAQTDVYSWMGLAMAQWFDWKSDFGFKFTLKHFNVFIVISNTTLA